MNRLLNAPRCNVSKWVVKLLVRLCDLNPNNSEIIAKYPGRCLNRGVISHTIVNCNLLLSEHFVWKFVFQKSKITQAKLLCVVICVDFFFDGNSLSSLNLDSRTMIIVMSNYWFWKFDVDVFKSNWLSVQNVCRLIYFHNENSSVMCIS